MMRNSRLFPAGSAPILPAAQFAMAAATVQHGTPEFRQLLQRVLGQLKAFIGTREDVVILSSSGTGAMEAAMSNVTSPGDRILVLQAGRYGERWTALGKNFGCHVDTVRKPDGQTFTPDDIRGALQIETRAVFVQADESSTGTRHDLEAIGRLLRDEESEALLAVDAITGLGTTPIDMDAWGIDVLIGSSQTSMIPQGLSYLAVGERAWDRMEATYNPRYYFDLRKERKNNLTGDTAFTPPVALIAALGASLDWVAEGGGGDVAEGRRKLVQGAVRVAAMARAALDALGFAPLSASPGAASTVVRVPEGVDGSVLGAELEAHFGVAVSDGQGDLKGQVLSLAHAGRDALDTLALIGALEQVLVARFPERKVTFGQGLVAAQQVLAASL